jgi:hypothetical protein
MSKGCDRVAFTHHVRDAQTRDGSRAWPRWLLPDGRSPLAVSLILDIGDPRVAQLANPTPQRIADLALPWECLFCPQAQGRALGTMIGTQPAWIEPVQGPASDEVPSADARPQEASYSLALGMSDEERDEYDNEVAER